jgi:hypothetical protein
VTDKPEPSKFTRTCGKILVAAVLAPIVALSAWATCYFLYLPFK